MKSYSVVFGKQLRGHGRRQTFIVDSLILVLTKENRVDIRSLSGDLEKTRRGHQTAIHPSPRGGQASQTWEPC